MLEILLDIPKNNSKIKIETLNTLIKYSRQAEKRIACFFDEDDNKEKIKLKLMQIGRDPDDVVLLPVTTKKNLGDILKFAQVSKNLTNDMTLFSDCICQEESDLLKLILESENFGVPITNRIDLGDKICEISHNSGNVSIYDKYLLNCSGLFYEFDNDTKKPSYRMEWTDKEVKKIGHPIEFIINSLHPDVKTLTIHSEISLYRDFVRQLRKDLPDASAQDEWGSWVRDNKRERQLEKFFHKVIATIDSKRAANLTIEIKDNTTKADYGGGLPHDRFLQGKLICYISSAGFNLTHKKLDDIIEHETYIMRVDSPSASKAADSCVKVIKEIIKNKVIIKNKK